MAVSMSDIPTGTVGFAHVAPCEGRLMENSCLIGMPFAGEGVDTAVV